MSDVRSQANGKSVPSERNRVVDEEINGRSMDLP